jgi:hypothetical protein
VSNRLLSASLFKTTRAGDSPADGVAVSATNTYYGEPVDKGSVPWAGLDFYWGTNVGTFTIQVSNKPAPVLTTDNDWKTLTLATPMTQPSGANTGDYVDLSDLPFRWVRVKYVNASGTGTIYCFISGQAVG